MGSITDHAPWGAETANEAGGSAWAARVGLVPQGVPPTGGLLEPLPLPATEETYFDLLGRIARRRPDGLRAQVVNDIGVEEIAATVLGG